MLRLKYHIPFHHSQIPSHLCALATQCLGLPSITITFLKDKLTGPQLQPMGKGLISTQWVPTLHLRNKTVLNYPHLAIGKETVARVIKRGT